MTALDSRRSAIYWHHRGHARPAAEEAFENRWFGVASHALTGALIRTFERRFEGSIDALRAWQPRDPRTQALVCHWHLQMVNDLYRDFTAGWLPARRLVDAKIDTWAATLWVSARRPAWSPAHARRTASGLLSAAREAGLLAGGKPVRPTVPDDALAYLLHTVRDRGGDVLANAHLTSVGLTEGLLEQRVRRLSCIEFHRMGTLVDFTWQHADAAAWAGSQAALGGEP